MKNKDKFHAISRRQATLLVEFLRELEAKLRNPKERHSDMGAIGVANEIARELEAQGVPWLQPCEGEAHSNLHIDKLSMYIDNCGCCIDTAWGYAGKPIKVR